MHAQNFMNKFVKYDEKMTNWLSAVSAEVTLVISMVMSFRQIN